MRSRIGLGLANLAVVVLISGCGLVFSGGFGFESNELARWLLGGTSWGDPHGQVQLTFDSDAKLTGLKIPNLPPELANLRIDGQPFTITIPSTGLPSELAGFAGRQVNARLQNTGTFVNPDGTMEIILTGLIDIPLVQKVTLKLAATTGAIGNAVTLNDISASLSVSLPFVGEIPIVTGADLASGVPVVKL